MSKSSDTYDKAVARARGAETETESAAPAIITPAAAMIRSVGADEIAKITNDPAMEFAPQLCKLEEGQMIEGVLEGNGPMAEFERFDKQTGVIETNRVQTWIIRDTKSGMRASILSSAQLDRKLAPFVGGLVKIVRGKDLNTGGGQRVTDYLVAGPRLKDGARSWATKPVIDAAPAAPQLPAGTPTNHAGHATHADPSHPVS